MSGDGPRVSIGLPVYNGERFLATALDSILAQTFTDFELIIADNASTDSTEEICTTYAGRDSRIRYYRNKKNLGAGRNFNLVFELARASYFKWWAYDDLCKPEFLSQCVAVLDAEPGVVLAYPRTLLLNEEGHVFGDYADDLHLMSPSAAARYRELFDKQGLCHAIYGVIRSDVLAQTALMTNIARGDRILLADLVLYGKFWEVPDYLFYRRIHPQNSTTVLSTEADLTIWFDPDKSNKVLMPKWQRLFAYMDAVRRAPITPVEKLRCFGVLARYTLKLDRWRGMIDDALRASRQMRAKRLQRG